MNNQDEILQKLIQYEPVLLAFFSLLLIGRIIHIPYLDIPFFISTYALLALYGYKTFVPVKQLNRAENNIRIAYLLLLVFGVITLFIHVQHWYNVWWAMKLFLIGIPMAVIVSVVRKIEFKGVFGETDVFLAVFTTIAFLLMLYSR